MAAPLESKNIVRLTSVPTEMEASIVVAALEEAGIRATFAGQHTAGFRAEAPGWVQVLVAQADVERAQELVEQFKAGHGEIDWSQVDVGEPQNE